MRGVRGGATGAGRTPRAIPRAWIAVLALAAVLLAGCDAALAEPMTHPDGAVPGASPSPAVIAAASVAPAATPAASSAGPTDTPASAPTAAPSPTPGVAAGPAWTTGSLALLARAGDSASAVAHVGKAFPLDLTSTSRVVGGRAWAEARWATPGRDGIAWVPLSAVTRSKPSRVAAASIDALDADLYRYLRSFGTRVGVEVRDLTRGMSYTHNAGRPYLIASSIKVELLAWFLSTLEKKHREPDARERALMTAMITRSDNDAAGYFYSLLGDAPGLTAYMKRIGVKGLAAAPPSIGWGWSTITPGAQVAVLTLLQQGKLLNARHTKYALDLMRHVIPEHRVGVGSTAPKGADVAMKVGWVPGPDDLWVMNSSGIVSYHGITYVIAVYTDRDPTLDEGFAIVEHACDAIATALLAGD